MQQLFFKMFGHEVDLSRNFFGVKKAPDGTIFSVDVLDARYQADVPPGWAAEDVKEYERAVARYLHEFLYFIFFIN